MTDEQYKPSKAEQFASLLTGNATQTSIMATVQRSHRFPMHIFIQIENMARMGNVPVSLVINELLECGLEAVLQEIPQENRQEINRITEAQQKMKTTTESVEVKKIRVAKTKIVKQ